MIYDTRRWGSRFLQVDPIEGGSANDYDYANAEPCNNVDLDGRAPHAIVIAGGTLYVGWKVWQTKQCGTAIGNFSQFLTRTRKYFNDRKIDVSSARMQELVTGSGYWHEMAYWCKGPLKFFMGRAYK